MRKSVFGGNNIKIWTGTCLVFKFGEHAQVIFRKLALEGSVAPHCPGYELPRYIKTAVWVEDLFRGTCSRFMPQRGTRHDLNQVSAVHHNPNTLFTNQHHTCMRFKTSFLNWLVFGSAGRLPNGASNSGFSSWMKFPYYTILICWYGLTIWDQQEQHLTVWIPAQRHASSSSPGTSRREVAVCKTTSSIEDVYVTSNSVDETKFEEFFVSVVASYHSVF